MKATEDDSKRSPTRRRLFGPVDHNQNKVDATLIWTNINPGFPRVDYSPRFRPRPPPLNTDSSSVTEAGRDDVEMEGEGEMEGDDVAMDDGSVTVTTEEVGYGREEEEPDERRSSGGIASSVQSADDDFVASLNSSRRRRSWTQTAASRGGPRGDMTSTSNLPSSGGRPESPSGCGSAYEEGSSVVRRRRPVSEHDHSTNDFTIEETDDDHAKPSSSSSLYSGSLDPSCRTNRPATCLWRTLTSSFTDGPGRMRSASLGHTSRPSCCCSGSRQRSCRHTTTTATATAPAEGGSRGGSPNLEPTYRKVPVVQLRGADQTTVLCPPGRTYFFKPIGGGGGEGGGEEDSPALTASQSPDEGGGRDDESSGGTTRGSIGDPPSRLQQEKTVAEKEEEEEEKEEEEGDASLDGNVVCGQEDVIGVDDRRLGPEVDEEEEEEEEEDRCPLPQQQQQQQSSRRRWQSIDETVFSLEREDEDEVAGHDCSDRKARNDDEDEDEGRAAAAAADRGRDRLSGRRIKDKLVTSPPKAKKRKPYEDGNSDSSY